MTAAPAEAMPDDLAAVLAAAWDLLDAAPADQTAALRAPVVIGLSDVAPDGRIMVLRGCDREAAHLVFHTDVRAPKAQARDARVAVVGYDAQRLIQLRMHGHARLERDGAAVEAAWRTTSPTARRNYATALPPGASLAAAGNGQRDGMDVAAARGNFARLIIELTQIDWLDLANTGHRRAVFTRSAQGWAGSWRVP